jgi:hypothetical protein
MCIRRGLDVNAPDVGLATALHIAARRGSYGQPFLLALTGVPQTHIWRDASSPRGRPERSHCEQRYPFALCGPRSAHRRHDHAAASGRAVPSCRILIGRSRRAPTPTFRTTSSKPPCIWHPSSARRALRRCCYRPGAPTSPCGTRAASLRWSRPVCIAALTCKPPLQLRPRSNPRRSQGSRHCGTLVALCKVHTGQPARICMASSNSGVQR